MLKKAELKFWDYTIRCMEKPSTRSAMQKLKVINWATIGTACTAILGGCFGLLASYLVHTAF